jgi:hypothetical protein
VFPAIASHRLVAEEVATSRGSRELALDLLRSQAVPE